MLDNKTFNKYVTEINYLKEELNAFTDLNIFEIKQNLKGYMFFGIKWGYAKMLKSEYKRKTILKYLNLIEFGLNNGLICNECLKVCKFGVYSDENSFYSKCLNFNCENFKRSLI